MNDFDPDSQAISRFALRELRRDELYLAAQLLGRGMCDNPMNVMTFGIAHRERRSRAMARFFPPVLQGLLARGLIMGAFDNACLVGVCVAACPRRCQPKTIEKLRVLPAIVFGNPIPTPLRVLKWVGEWSRRDPKEPHWHLGPIAVDWGLQRRGIGSALLSRFCADMDGKVALSYLETDRSENVGFYQRFGFSVVAKAEVLGITNWFMSRLPAKQLAMDA
jgi:ribosomal protein S18 acetylase RimI-like enzyme